MLLHHAIFCERPRVNNSIWNKISKNIFPICSSTWLKPRVNARGRYVGFNTQVYAHSEFSCSISWMPRARGKKIFIGVIKSRVAKFICARNESLFDVINQIGCLYKKKKEKSYEEVNTHTRSSMNIISTFVSYSYVTLGTRLQYRQKKKYLVECALHLLVSLLDYVYEPLALKQNNDVLRDSINYL